jgi:phosphoglucosamine mutase
MDVFQLGPMPTPAVAMLTRSLRADLGVMISASHNPFIDNGIKLFSGAGFKLSDDQEQEIEDLVLSGRLPEMVPAPRDMGRAYRLADAHGRYIVFLKNTFPQELDLSGMKIVLDCANGAAYKVAPEALWELGAEVIRIGVDPNGLNINKDCGSTDLAAVIAKVHEVRADIGIALDGDADRVIIIDEKGQVVDGDQLMAVVAASFAEDSRLTNAGVVATVMSNLGLERYLGGLGLELVRTKVGDRYVVEAMRSGGYNVGGEQSGHIVLSDFSTTGDGLVAALQVLAGVKKQERPVSEVCHRFDPVPQILRNVRTAGGRPLELDSVRTVIASATERLGKHGRVLVRPSGTEPLIRVMGEGDDAGLVSAVVDDIITAISAAA